jgi:cation transport regulator ChaC
MPGVEVSVSVAGTRGTPENVASIQYVFGYGSLLERGRGSGVGHAPGVADLHPAELSGYRRTWNVAMDNSRTIPGYKYYVDAVTGERRDWFVTFLNVVPDPRSSVNGVVFAVSDALLAELDRRERNYDRVEVSARVCPAREGRVWVYAGSASAVRRFERGARAGRAAVAAEYRRRVIDDFAALGPEAVDRFERLTDPPPCPVLELRRVDLPPTGKSAPVTKRDGDGRGRCAQAAP